jgi:hypothetical protein
MNTSRMDESTTMLYVPLVKSLVHRYTAEILTILMQQSPPNGAVKSGQHDPAGELLTG